MKLSLLLVDDDAEYSHLLRRVLERAGAEVSLCAQGRQAIAAVAQKDYDLMLLDVAMPEMDGFAVLHQLRRVSEMPVIMLTSRIASADRVQGLDGGADDYICKPCDPDELLSRIRAVLRRVKKTEPAAAWFVIGRHRFEMKARELLHAGEPVRLTSLEGELLFMLLQARGKVVPREQMTRELQDRELNAFDRSLDVHVSRLRTKLGPDAGAIQTVRGVGYAITGAREDAPSDAE